MDENSIKVIPANELDILKHAGTGGFGIVSKATYNGHLVAIKYLDLKRLQMTKRDERAAKDFISEMIHLNQLHHPNIVKFYGRCSEPEMAYVMEFMTDGSLHDLLYKKVEYTYKYENVLNWAEQCSSALAYLHSKHLVHGDLKPGNILLKDDHQTLKLADFGKLTQAKLTLKNGRSTFTYMAPEQFQDKPSFDSSVDVYAFGITIWEVFARQRPFKEYDARGIPYLVQNRIRPLKLTNIPKRMMDLIDECWHQDPAFRPQIKDVHETIGDFMKACNSRMVLTESTLGKYCDNGRYDTIKYMKVRQSLEPVSQTVLPGPAGRAQKKIEIDFDYARQLQLTLTLKHLLIRQLKEAEELKRLIARRDLLKKIVDQANERIARQAPPPPPAPPPALPPRIDQRRTGRTTYGRLKF